MHPALHLLVDGAWRRQAEQGGRRVGLLGAGERVTGLVCRGIREDLEAVGRSQALPPVEQTLPPAVALRHVLLQDGEDVAPAESQLVGAVGAVVVKRPRQERLGAGGRKKSLLWPLPRLRFQCRPPGNGRSRSPLPFYLLSSSPRARGPTPLFLPVLGGDTSHPQGE